MMKGLLERLGRKDWGGVTSLPPSGPRAWTRPQCLPPWGWLRSAGTASRARPCLPHR